MSSAPKKILLAQLFSNGDCLYATAIARQIKHDYPGCHLTWSIAPFCRGVLIGNPHVDEVMEVDSVPKSDIVAYRRFKREMRAQQAAGRWDEVFFTVNMDDNMAWYDGCIRTNILHAYPHPITEGITPVLRFTEEEKGKVEAWTQSKNLRAYRHVILFEFAPQSGQLDMSREKAIRIAEALASRGDTAVILSSAQKVEHPSAAIVDGSELSYRESVLLSNWCTMMLGCSSGITWGTTSDGGKLLPMVQLLNPWTPWVNPISRDFERHSLPVEQVIELTSFSEDGIVQCVQTVLNEGFAAARSRYNQPIPLQFKTTRRIVYNLLVYARFAAIIRHLRVNIKAFGPKPALFGATALAIIELPVKLFRNRVLRKRS